MNNILKLSLLGACLLPASMDAQEVDRTKYPDYTSTVNPDWSLLKPMRKVGAKAAEKRPDHVNNAETPYFPPVFNQDGGSCGSASRICYMFTHELNSFRDKDGHDPHNYYPSHFVWLLTNGNSGKDDFVQHVGVPSAATYGGQTYSKLFGYQEETNDDFGWMTGYEKWYEAMFNRMQKPSNFPISVETEAGREAVKNWLWNHNGDTDFHSGGIVGIGVASGGNWQNIPSTPTNDELGVTGMKYVKAWGQSVDHALTIVGYDDRIEFDIDGNGVYGEKDKDEVGAWIVVNSWGSGWCNGGFIYCPYANAGPSHSAGSIKPNGYYQPEIYRVRKNYVPKRTIKIKMDYSRRSELYLSAGISSDVNATEPEMSQAFDHFKYAGDGHNGNTVPAPEIPMLGRWADGQLHTEPMEFGYDLTDLTANFDLNKPLKYFFMIDTKSTAVGSGHVYNASILDYVQDALGVETPFDTGKDGVEIQNKGNRTIISVVVQGEGVYAPENVAIADGSLTWSAPTASKGRITGYKIYKGSELLGTVDGTATSYALGDVEDTEYGVVAVYGSKESIKVTALAPVTSTDNQVINLKNSGFTIPGIFGTKYENATIEYWIKCNSLKDWNQSAGPGWGTFMFHGNANGTFTAGWDTSNRLNASGALSTTSWKHVALVVKGKQMIAYVNGVQAAGKVASGYSGIGGFGDLVFSSNGNSAQDAQYDEIRIWKTARTAAEIRNNYRREMGDAGLSDDLLAYYKGDIIMVDGAPMLRDHTKGQHHATIHNVNYESTTSTQPSLLHNTALTVKIAEPASTVYAGQPVALSADASIAAEKIEWMAESAGVKSTTTTNPTFIFPTVGEHEVIAKVTDREGNTAADTIKVNAVAAPAPDASFTATSLTVPTGQRVTFLAKNPQVGYTYKWEMPGAETTESTAPNAATSYGLKGTYTVRLTITSPTGQTATTEQQITVTEVAPEADFNISSAVVVKGEPVVMTDNSKYGPTLWNWSLVSNENAIAGEGKQFGFVSERPGVYDVTLNAGNSEGQNTKTIERGLIICNADAENGLNFGYDAARVTATKNPLVEGSNKFTVDWWMQPKRLAAQGNGIGESAETFLINTTSTGAMKLSVAGHTVTSAAGYVVENQWHHYAVVVGSGTTRFYRDGVQFSTAALGATVKVPAIDKFSLGTDAAPMSGLVDEFRVWNKNLTAAQLKTYCNEPVADMTAAEALGLSLYYQFNQNSGDVKDATSNANTGVRSGFGPDGDAWSSSRGVFCLNFTDSKTDVSSRLKNRKAPFSYTSDLVNNDPQVPNRCYSIRDWTLENVTEGKQHTGCYVDQTQAVNMAFVTTYFGFDETIKDHKVYQTVTLPAGTYLFTAKYGDYEGRGMGSYLVVADGEGLPDTDGLSDGSIAFKALETKSEDTMENSVMFQLSEQKEVSLGLLVNMSGSAVLTFSEFTLMKYPMVELQMPEGIDSVLAPGAAKQHAVYDLWGRRVVNPVKGGIYVVDGQKVVVK